MHARPSAVPTAPLLAALLLLAAAGPLPGQGGAADRAAPRPQDRGACPARDASPDWPFVPPAASPLEPVTRLAPVRIRRGDRERWVGLVDLGDRFPFWLRRPPCPGTATGGGDGGGPAPPVGRAARAGPALAASLAGGAFSRFDLESSQNDFIEVHFRVGLRLLARVGELEARAELYHVSSHLGDEYLLRTGRDPVSTSREGLELLVGGRPLYGLRLYGGAGLLVRSSREFQAASLRAGAEWAPEVRRGAFRPYVAAELFAWDEQDWSPAASAEAGLRFGGSYRVGLVAGAGPSRADQFFRENETLVGLSFSADL